VIERIPVVIVGGGQAGLSVSYGLSGAGVEHVVLERARIGESWRRRWDSFCLVTPNWTVQLPGGPYEGNDPNGFMLRDDIVGHLEAYAERIGAPVRSGVEVTSTDLSPGGGFRLQTSAGEMLADALVAATGAFQKPHRPTSADTLPPDLLAIDSEDYTNPGDLPGGKVLVVGSGQTGCQIAEELHAAGREVSVSCGRAPWAPRQIDGRDIVAWLLPTPFMDQTLADLPSPQARLGANPQFSGRDGGHDLNYRTLSNAGVTLAGHFLGAEDHSARFAPDLAETVAFGDARYGEICNLIRKGCIERGEVVPEFPQPGPFTAQGPDRMDLRNCAAVIFTCGYRPDYRRWIRFPDAFDGLGFPTTRDGASTAVPGLYFIGTHFLRKRKSSLLFGVGEDAAVVVDAIVRQLA
jgi:putative flavoprotein involved in K+ transport